MQRHATSRFVAIATLILANCLGTSGASHANPLTEADCTITAVADQVTTGTSGNDVICGTPGDDTINGAGGNDTIFGESGDDTIYGGQGNDTIEGGNDDDVIDSGEGNDTVNGDNGNDAIDVGPGDDYAYGGSGGDLLFGGNGSDALNGDAGNDSLNGQNGNDILNGGGDVDYCDSVGSDTESSCFSDNSRPKLVSIAVSNDSKSFNTNAAAKTITIRARIKDTGLGIYHARLVITGGADQDVLPIGFDWRAASGGSDCSYDIDIQESPDAYACRISGNANDGVYEFHNVVKRFTPKMTWRVHSFAAQDSAGNETDLDYSALKSLRLSPTLRQTGDGDVSTPVLDDINIVNPSISTRNSGVVVTTIVKVHDTLSGFSSGNLTFYSTSKHTEIRGNIGFPKSCSEITANDALETQTSTNCLATSSGNSKTFHSFTYFPKGTPKATYRLEVELYDHVQNGKFYSYKQLKAVTSDRKIEQTGTPIPKLPASYSKPEITKISAVTTSVNASNGPALIELSVTFTDVGSQVNSMELDLGRITGSGSGTCFGCGLNVYFNYFTNDEQCNSGRTSAATPVAAATACLISGTRSNGIFSLKAYLPAHASSGDYFVGSAYLRDAKGHVFNWNINFRETSPLQAKVHNR